MLAVFVCICTDVCLYNRVLRTQDYLEGSIYEHLLFLKDGVIHFRLAILEPSWYGDIEESGVALLRFLWLRHRQILLLVNERHVGVVT